MDLSKLPRLSKTPAAPAADMASEPTAEAPTGGAVCPFCRAAIRDGAKFCESCGQPLIRTVPAGRLASAAPEAWISLVIAVILLFMSPRFLQYLAPPHNTATLDAIDGATGAIIPYASSAFIWT